MTEPTDPKSGADQTSRQNPKEPGIFRPVPDSGETTPAPTDNETSPKASKRVDGIRSGKPVNLEKLRLRERLLGKIEILLEDAKFILTNDADKFPENTLEEIISELEVFKNLLESSEDEVEKIAEDISGIEKELAGFQSNLRKSIKEKDEETLELQNQLGRLMLLVTAQSNYNTLKYNLKEELTQLHANGDQLAKNFENLEWLTDTAKLEEFAKNNDSSEIQKIYNALDDIGEKILTAVEAIAKEDEEFSGQQKRIIEEGEKQTAEFSKLEEESSKLKVLDIALTTLHAELKANAKHVEAEFYKSPSDVSLTKFDDALLKYSEVLATMREKVVITVPDPTPEPVTPSLAEESASPDSEDIPTGRTPWDIDIPNISKDERAKKLENSYKVKIDGKFITVPWVLLGTLNRYNTTFNDVENKDKDFTKAIELKETVCNAIEVADFKLADDNARVLGALLDTFEKKKEVTLEPEPAEPSKAPVPTPVPPSSSKKIEPTIPSPKPIATKAVTPTTPEEEPSVDEDPEAYKRRGFWNTRVSTISLDATKNWRIKKGNVYVKMNDQELAAWLPIYDILTEYSSFVNSPDQAYNFPFLVQQKNELLDALEANDFSSATELAKNLAKEFDPMLDKENIPEQEKTAARIQHEVRQFNLSRLANTDNLILNDDTTRFAFIKEPQSTTNREYRIIDRNTGEWVQLTKKDLAIVDLAQRALTQFKNQTSKSPESIQKKNEILAYINDYDFEGAKVVIEEYLAEFSGITKASPLRPTVSGSEPSPAVKKVILSKTITEELERLTAIEKILNQSLPYLSSDLEKAAFTKLLQKQKTLEVSVRETPTTELTNALKRGNDFLATELDKKKNFIEAQFGDITKSIPSELNNDTILVRSARLRGATDARETLGERAARLKNEEGSADIAQTRAIDAKAELLETHKRMFAENPTQYKEIYANENKVRDSVTEAISTHTLADIAVPHKDEEAKRKDFLKNLVGLSPQDILKDLTLQERAVMKKKQELIANNLHGVTIDNYDEEMNAIEAELLVITENKKKYTAAILGKFTKREPVEISSRKQVYRPSQDDSLNDTTTGLGQKFEFNEKNEAVKVAEESRENLTQEQIEQRFANEINPNDPQAVRPLQEKVNLAGSPYPNHTKGMSPVFNEGEGEEPQHAFSNADIEKVRKEIEEEQAAKEALEAKERANEKLARGGRLFDSLVKKLKPTTKKQWFMLGLTALGLSTGTGLAFGKEVKGNAPEDKRLIDEYKTQSGWEKYVADKVSKDFLKDFSGGSKLNYKDLLVKYAPSFNINPNNPSNGDKLSNLLCKDVYFVVGANAGINEKQQVESSILIDNLKEVMIAAKASLGTLYSEEAINSGAIFGGMTIQQYYDAVSKEIEKAEADKARIQGIKR